MSHSQARNPVSNGLGQDVVGGKPSEGYSGPQGRSWKLTIPAPCKWLSMNSRIHWAVRAELTRLWRTAARVYAQQAKLPKGLKAVHVEARIWKPTNRSYDAHNTLPTLKACIDGVVDYGLLKDDSNEHLIGPDVRHGGVGPAAVVLIITEITRSKSGIGT